jgi:hypothetical protein
MKTNKELLVEAIASLTPEQLAAIYPPIQRANFVVRKSWLGRNQVITFVNNKNQKVTYNHDEVLKVMLPSYQSCPVGLKENIGHNQPICRLMLDTWLLLNNLKYRLNNPVLYTLQN